MPYSPSSVEIHAVWSTDEAPGPFCVLVSVPRHDSHTDLNKQVGELAEELQTSPYPKAHHETIFSNYIVNSKRLLKRGTEPPAQ